ncbi:MAG TPA: heavy metal sensor histidine kinase [Candidatus Xenobia bacterium]|nr:heavy metal sensor histidine kinase [Candidatus Xenobia bacterium]
MRPLGVRTKLALFYAVVVGVVLSLLGALYYNTLTLRLERSVNAELDERAAALRGYLQFKDGRPVLHYKTDDPEESYFIRIATRYYQVYDAETGELLVQSPELDLLGMVLPPEQVRDLAARPRFTEFDTPEGRVRFHNHVIHDRPHRAYLVQVGTSLASVDSTREELLGTLLLIIPAGVLFAGLAGWWMARSALKPVEALTAGAREVNISRLDRRLPLRGTGDELDRLADTFNQVFARLEAAVEQMRQFTASISHELRTPLTALRGEAEVTLLRARSAEDYRQVLASQLEEFDKLTRMINELLILARAEAGEIRLEKKPTDLAALVRSLAEAMELVAASKDLKLQVEAAVPVVVAADAQWLERVVLNLLDNAIKFTPAGGRVSLEVKQENSAGCLAVRDTGVGIPAEALPRIFDRFYRADPSRSREVDGAGLGLALVQWIVREHHGEVKVESEPGRGTCVVVRLPQSD